MSVVVLKCGAWKIMMWLAARLDAPRRCPVPLSRVRGHVEALMDSPHGATMLIAVATVAFVLGVRSGWRDMRGRWYSR